jgi:hypothetical protein
VQRPEERLPKLAVTPHAPRGKAEAVSAAMSGYIGGTVFMRDGEGSLVVQLQISDDWHGGGRLVLNYQNSAPIYWAKTNKKVRTRPTFLKLRLIRNTRDTISTLLRQTTHFTLLYNIISISLAFYLFLTCLPSPSLHLKCPPTISFLHPPVSVPFSVPISRAA